MNSYNTLEEIRELLLPKGFKEYKPSPFDNDAVITNFQKRYDDELGKKYFIDAKIWDYSWTDIIPENYHIEYETQLYKSGNHDAVSMEFLDWTIEQVEEFVDGMFKAGLIEHYERWDE